MDTKILGFAAAAGAALLLLGGKKADAAPLPPVAVVPPPVPPVAPKPTSAAPKPAPVPQPAAKSPAPQLHPSRDPGDQLPPNLPPPKHDPGMGLPPVKAGEVTKIPGSTLQPVPLNYAKTGNKDADALIDVAKKQGKDPNHMSMLDLMNSGVPPEKAMQMVSNAAQVILQPTSPSAGTSAEYQKKIGALKAI